MADTDPAIIGVQSCGCVTLAIARPRSPLPRGDRKAVIQITESGGSVVHTTVGEAKAREHFLPWECPHDPKGWEPDAA